MTLLFKRSSLQAMGRSIFRATYQHARNLACFVTLYKTCMLFLKHLKGAEHNGDAFVSGRGRVVSERDSCRGECQERVPHRPVHFIRPLTLGTPQACSGAT